MTALKSAAKPAFHGIERVPFRFAVGELRLFSPSLPLAVVEFEPGVELSPTWRDELPPLGNADGYLLRSLPATAAGLASAFAQAGWFIRVLREYPRHLVDLSTGFDDYMAKFSAKTRSTLKRKLRKLQELSAGAIRWDEFRTKDEVARFLPLARALSAKTYQERLLDAGLPNSAAFTAQALDLAANDAVRAYILYLGDAPASYLYLPVERGRVVYAYLGYDPAHAQHSPGTVLQLLAMERLFAEPGLKVFDFTEGAGQHKELFATHAVQCVDVVLLRDRRGARALARAHGAFSNVEAAFVGLLDRLGLKAQIKRIVRRVLGA
jgi:CelD/BcsL family acetyltransferase involved in cellulose biosynthesis